MIVLPAFPLGYPGEDFQQPLGADAAGGTFAAGLGLGEFQKEPGRTIQSDSSSTTMPPEPIIDPTLARFS